MDTAIVLAGGLGTRLRSVVSDRPKPMALVRNRPFLEYLLRYWIGHDVRQFILSVGYKAESIIDYFGTQFCGASIAYSVEKTPLGTGGAVAHALTLHKSNTPCWLLNGDTYFEINSNDMLKQFHSADCAGCLATISAPQDERYGGLEIDQRGRLLGFKSTAARLGEPANGGVYILNPALLLSVTADYTAPYSLESDVLPRLIAGAAAFYAVPSAANFLDIGVPADYARAAELLPQF